MSAALVLVEHAGGRPRRACLEALGKARALGFSPVALVQGMDPALVAPYADRVLASTHDDHPEAHVLALRAAIDRTGAALVLGPCTLTGCDALARAAAAAGRSLVPDAVRLDLEDGAPRVVRPVHGGKVLARIALTGDAPWFVAVRGNAFPAPDPADPGAVEEFDPGIDPSTLLLQVVERRQAATGRIPVTEADIIVTGGRGLGESANFSLLERLADRLGAAVGASRAVVDAGWRDVSEQVGKSGNTVAPRLYVAFGVAGAVHHVMGMDGAGTVVVVNKDENALFFQHADHGLAADAIEVLPALLEELGDG